MLFQTLTSSQYYTDVTDPAQPNYENVILLILFPDNVDLKYKCETMSHLEKLLI